MIRRANRLFRFVLLPLALAACDREEPGASTTVPVAVESHSVPTDVVTKNTPAGAAASGLKELRELTTPENCESMGFTSMQEVGTAELGQGMKVYMIGLNDLKALSPNADANSVLLDNNEQLFPVLAAGTARAAIVVRQNSDDKGWEVVSIGDASNMKRLDSARLLDAKRNGGRTYSVIRIPSIDRTFLGFTDASNTLHFISTREDREIAGRNGEARQARTMLDGLTKIAKSTKAFASPFNQ